MSYLDKLAEEYSFNIESKLFPLLPLGLIKTWREDCQWHFKNGYQTCQDNMDVKWFSVFDREPAIDEKVLVVTTNHKFGISSMYETECGEKAWRGSCAFNDAIIAWCPIPKFDLDYEF